MAGIAKIGQDLAIGGIMGAIDQFIQEEDDKRAAKYITDNATKTPKPDRLPIWNQYGTYFNYGLPVVAALASYFGYINGAIQTEVTTGAGALAGRKLVHYIIYKDVVKNPQSARGLAPWMAAPNMRAPYEITQTTDTLGANLMS